LKLATTKLAGGEPPPATKLLYQHLTKKAVNRDLNDDTHQDGLWESTLSRLPVFNPAGLPRALVGLAVAGARVMVRAKLTVRNSDLQTPRFERSLSRALPILKEGMIW
jgi:hypothetical protein